MKNKQTKKRIQRIAAKIVEWEKQAEENPEQAMKLMEEIASTLSVEDLLEVDEYISKNRLLTK